MKKGSKKVAAVGVSIGLILLNTVFAQPTIIFTPKEIRTISSHGPWPSDLPEDPGNEYSRQLVAVQLGQRFFNDVKLSGNGEVSCASCHQADKGFTDGLPVAKGAATHVRNTQGLLDIAQQRWLGWDGGTDSLWAASLRPMLSAIEMHNTETGIARHLKTLPASTWANLQTGNHAPIQLKSMTDNEIAVMVAKLIAAYTRTLTSGTTTFDDFRIALINNNQIDIQTFPDAAKRGLKLFLGEANCRLCHFGPNFSNGEFHNTGRPFLTGVGRVDPGRYTGIQRLRNDQYNLLGKYASSASAQQKRKTATVKLEQNNWGQWRTPSLRNLALTAPYMHDGSISTLRGVVDAYADVDPERIHTDGEAIIKPLNLSDRDRTDLVTFLRTLSP